MPRFAPIGALAALALACATSSHPSASAPPGRALLAFAWPPGLEADVFVRTTKIRVDGRALPERSVETRHRLRTEPHERGLRVASSDLQVLRLDGRDVLASGPETDPTALFLAPTLIVDESGNVLDVEGLDALRRGIAERIVAESGDPATADQVAAIAASRERITDHWTSAVAGWTGLDVDPGSTREVELEAADGTRAPGRIEVSERTRCHDEDPLPRCLRLRLESRSAGKAGVDDMQSRVRALSAQLGVADLPVDTIRSSEDVEVIELVTEPERLLPHSVHVRRERRIELEADGVRRTIESVDDSQHLYRWQSESAGGR